MYHRAAPESAQAVITRQRRNEFIRKRVYEQYVKRHGVPDGLVQVVLAHPYLTAGDVCCSGTQNSTVAYLVAADLYTVWGFLLADHVRALPPGTRITREQCSTCVPKQLTLVAPVERAPATTTTKVLDPRYRCVLTMSHEQMQQLLGLDCGEEEESLLLQKSVESRLAVYRELAYARKYVAKSTVFPAANAKSIHDDLRSYCAMHVFMHMYEQQYDKPMGVAHLRAEATLFSLRTRNEKKKQLSITDFLKHRVAVLSHFV